MFLTFQRIFPRIALVSIICFLAPMSATSEQFDLNDAILFERDEYVYVDVEKITLFLLKAEQHSSITNMIDEIFSPYFELEYIKALPTAPLAPNTDAVKLEGDILIAIGSIQDIRNSNPLKNMTTIPGAFDIVEFGKPLEEWFASRWNRERHIRNDGLIFTYQMLPTTCSSFYSRGFNSPVQLNLRYMT